MGVGEVSNTRSSEGEISLADGITEPPGPVGDMETHRPAHTHTHTHTGLMQNRFAGLPAMYLVRRWRGKKGKISLT